MRGFLASLFRLLLRNKFLKSKHFGIYKRIIKPYDLFKGVTRHVTRKGFKLVLNIDDWIQHNIYFLGGYEEAELKAVEKLINKGSYFIDVGSNIGLFTLHASAFVAETGRVISFAPGAASFSSLQEHIKLNELQNVTIEKMALGNRIGKVRLYYNDREKNLGMASLQPQESIESEEVEISTLDDYLEENPCKQIDFIKIDAEGYEYEVVKGMKKTLFAYKPNLLIEILDEQIPTENSQVLQIFGFLEQLGYIKYYIGDDGSISPTEINPLRRNFLFKQAK